MDALEQINNKTDQVMSEWKDAYGYAPDSAAKKLDVAMLDWISDLSSCLQIWVDKTFDMTPGELILARVNLGALVECWLKFFYCVYNEDYSNNPQTRKGKKLEPNDLTLEDLKVMSRGILWNQGDNTDLWVQKIQIQRNAVHAFNYRDIGTDIDFLMDLDTYTGFIQLIIDRLPESPASYRSWL